MEQEDINSSIEAAVLDVLTPILSRELFTSSTASIRTTYPLQLLQDCGQAASQVLFPFLNQINAWVEAAYAGSHVEWWLLDVQREFAFLDALPDPFPGWSLLALIHACLGQESATVTAEMGYRLLQDAKGEASNHLDTIARRAIDSLLMDCRPWQDWQHVRQMCSAGALLRRLLDQLRHTLDSEPSLIAR